MFEIDELLRSYGDHLVPFGFEVGGSDGVFGEGFRFVVVRLAVVFDV